jgi:hypothetical protein
MRQGVILIAVLHLFLIQTGCKKDVRNVDGTKRNSGQAEVVSESDKNDSVSFVSKVDSLYNRQVGASTVAGWKYQRPKPEPDNYVQAPVEPYFPYFPYEQGHLDNTENNSEVYYIDNSSSVLYDYYDGYSASGNNYNYYYYDEYYPAYSDSYFRNYHYSAPGYYYVSPPAWGNRPHKPGKPDRPEKSRPPQKPDPIRPERPETSGTEFPSRRPLPGFVSGKENVEAERLRREADSRRQREIQDLQRQEQERRESEARRQRETQERQEQERRESEARRQRETQERQERERRESEARRQRETQERQEQERRGSESGRQSGRR